MQTPRFSTAVVIGLDHVACVLFSQSITLIGIHRYQKGSTPFFVDSVILTRLICVFSWYQYQLTTYPKAVFKPSL